MNDQNLGVYFHSNGAFVEPFAVSVTTLAEPGDNCVVVSLKMMLRKEEAKKFYEGLAASVPPPLDIE